jgi:hypothetical protein
MPVSDKDHGGIPVAQRLRPATVISRSTSASVRYSRVNLGSQAEDGTLQLVATYVSRPSNVVIDSYFIQSGVATPLPAALPLFATGIGGLGLLGWRRKRKAQATA